MVDWITVGVVSLVIIVAASIFYKALQDPINLVLYWAYRGILWIKNMIANNTQRAVATGHEVTYG